MTTKLRHKFAEGEINTLTEPFSHNEDMCDLARAVYGMIALCDAGKAEPETIVRRFVMQYFQKYNIGYVGSGRMVTNVQPEEQDETSNN